MHRSFRKILTTGKYHSDLSAVRVVGWGDGGWGDGGWGARLTRTKSDEGQVQSRFRHYLNRLPHSVQIDAVRIAANHQPATLPYRLPYHLCRWAYLQVPVLVAHREKHPRKMNIHHKNMLITHNLRECLLADVFCYI